MPSISVLELRGFYETRGFLSEVGSLLSAETGGGFSRENLGLTLAAGLLPAAVGLRAKS